MSPVVTDLKAHLLEHLAELEQDADGYELDLEAAKAEAIDGVQGEDEYRVRSAMHVIVHCRRQLDDLANSIRIARLDLDRVQP